MTDDWEGKYIRDITGQRAIRNGREETREEDDNSFELNGDSLYISETWIVISCWVVDY